MDQGPADRGLTERGVTSVQFLLAAGMALLLFLLLANIVVVQYGRGAIRSALEQGVRAGAFVGSADRCEATSRSVVDELLGGRMSDDLVIRCSVEAGRVTAEATASFESWTILTPDFVVRLGAEATLEVTP
ncbi:MAG: hypothetical protein L0Z63_10595 [Actinobacteria bacterium]|nr:hypothetical protein [Actinomycetota bacterium]